MSEQIKWHRVQAGEYFAEYRGISLDVINHSVYSGINSSMWNVIVSGRCDDVAYSYTKAKEMAEYIAKNRS